MHRALPVNPLAAAAETTSRRAEADGNQMTNRTSCPQWLPRPIQGAWPFQEYPEKIVLTYDSKEFHMTRSIWNSGKTGAEVVYRGDEAQNSLHLDVFANRTYQVDHIDCINPDKSLIAAARHADTDAGYGGWATLGLFAVVTISVLAVINSTQQR